MLHSMRLQITEASIECSKCIVLILMLWCIAKAGCVEDLGGISKSNSTCFWPTTNDPMIIMYHST